MPTSFPGSLIFPPKREVERPWERGWRCANEEKKRKGETERRKSNHSPCFFAILFFLEQAGYELVVSLSVHSNTVASVPCGSFELFKFIQYLTSRLRSIKYEKSHFDLWMNSSFHFFCSHHS